MELIFLLILMSAVSGVMGQDPCFVGHLLSGLTIAILIITIICLSIALYMARNNKTILGININKPSTYIRQESTQGATLCKVTSANNVTTINEHGRDDGSTLTVNSGIVEIGGIEPETPTRKEEPKSPYVVKKPKGPVVPPFQKAQMDQIIAGVLKGKQKSDSATFRELDDLAKPKNLKTYNDEFSVRRNSASLNHLDALANSADDESLYENSHAIQEMKNKYMAAKQNKTQDEKQNRAVNVSKSDVKHSPSFKASKPKYPAEEVEQEVYDTLPNPVRLAGGAEDDIENIPVYDLPPRRNEKNHPRNVVMDQDSQYLLPLSKRPMTDDEENSYYLNANQLHK